TRRHRHPPRRPAHHQHPRPHPPRRMINLCQVAETPAQHHDLLKLRGIALWGLCDVNPAKIHLSVPKSARVRRVMPATYEIHTRDLDTSDIDRFEGIPVVTPHRAVLDGVERHLDRRLIGQAIDSARRRGLVDRDELAALQDALR
ncbi:MAG: hypothetical protein ACR2G2_08940, partial [Pseudonocardia sp.]